MRIAIISDMHSSTGHAMEEAGFLIRYFGRGPLKAFKRAMKSEIEGHRHVRETLARMLGPDEDNPTRYDLVICNGDVSQTGDESELREAHELIREYFPNTPIVFVLGNHDTRSYILFTDKWFENFSQDQLDLFKSIFEDQEPYGQKSLTPNINLVWLMSDPFIFDWHRHSRHLSAETCELLHDLKEEQLDFLKKTLSSSETSGKRIVLAIHDPSILLSGDLRNVLLGHESQILVTLTGHIHARWLMRLMCFWHPILWPQLLWRMRTYKARLVSSVWGITLPNFLWMAGGGWSVLELEEGGNKLTSYYVNSDRFIGETLGEAKK